MQSDEQGIQKLKCLFVHAFCLSLTELKYMMCVCICATASVRVTEKQQGIVSSEQ